MNFSVRSYQKELLDEDSIPFVDIRRNMEELNFINTWLGGHTITIEGFKQLTCGKKHVSVCEIGSGGGDNLLAIYNYCKRKQIDVSITGIDIKKECVEFAKTRNAFPGSVKWIISDYSTVNFDKKPDIIFSSLFCHHFTHEQLIFQFEWMKKNSGTGFFINDLQRNVIAYYSIQLLTRLFSSSYLVKKDAPLSVARGFNQRELKMICKEAHINRATICWKWAFRYLVVYKHA